MQDPARHGPTLLSASAFAESDVGVCEWSPGSRPLSVSNDAKTIAWKSRKWTFKRKLQPAWLPVSTRLHLHSGEFRLGFVIDEMAQAQIGVGFMMLWNVGPDWGFFGYLGASSTAWAYDPSTGDVVCNTRSIQGNLPKFSDGRTGIVSVHLHLPRESEGSANFTINGVETQPIRLSVGAVVMPAACLLKEGQRVTLARFEQIRSGLS